MCGITGIISIDGADIPPGVVERMTECLRHRGPDDEGFARLPGCHLGHRRLSIIDLAGGAQPMTEDEGEDAQRFWITFNGEIYNYRELRQTLQARGWAFRTASDTEVILRAYQEYGEDAPKHLNGQFAFAIWDRQEQRLFAARDRLGEKPFYWARAHDGRRWLFASEIKALLASGLIHPRLDRLAVDLYLALYYVPPDRTIYENVHTLRPGHALIWQNGQVRTWAYWEPAFSRAAIDPQEAVEEVRRLVAQAVRRQMVADVPVGAFLSGGLDSGTVVALMTEYTDQPLMTFSVGFGDLIDELPYARDVAQRYHTDHHEIQMDIALGAMADRMAEVYDAPFADSSNIPTYLISEFAARSVKVALSGDGGDELFGGYAWYKMLLDNHPLEDAATHWAALGAAAYGLAALAKLGLPVIERRDAAMRRYRAARCPDVWDYHLSLASLLKTDRAPLWGGRAFETESALRAAYGPDRRHGMDRATAFDVGCYLPGDILVKVDRAAMAHGLETRAPFLDVDLVDFVWGLPWQLRFKDRALLKHLLRAACRDLWPASLHNRPKQGFGAPVDAWVQHPDIKARLQRVAMPGSPLSHLLPGAQAALPGMGAQQKWVLLCLGLWLERRPECMREVA